MVVLPVRHMLNSLFHPFVKGKLLFLELYNRKSDWDVPLTAEKKAEWNLWKVSLQDLQQLKIPQTYTPMSISHTIIGKLPTILSIQIQM